MATTEVIQTLLLHGFANGFEASVSPTLDQHRSAVPWVIGLSRAQNAQKSQLVNRIKTGYSSPDASGHKQTCRDSRTRDRPARSLSHHQFCEGNSIAAGRSLCSPAA